MSWSCVPGVLGTCLLGGLCVAPLIIIVVAVLEVATHLGLDFASPLAVLAFTLVLGPFSAVFTTVMYCLATGERGRLDAVVPAPGRVDAPLVGP